MKARLVGIGTRPLLMHNIQLASPLNPYAKKLKQLNGKRSSTRTDEDRMEISRVEWEGGLYFNPETGPYIPASWVFKCLVEGARLTKLGKKIERGVMVENMEHPLIYAGPRTLEGLWGGGDSSYIDIRTAKVGMARIDRCRPIFRDWRFEADLHVDTSIIDIDELSDVAASAGALVGLGDYRMLYGRFSTVVESL